MKLNTSTLSADEFVKRWQNASATERQSYQEHFRDVCHLVGAATPGETQQFDDYTFEYGLKKTDGRQGYADVFYRNHFAIEYKGKDKYKDLTDAYRQLQQYRENLDNPPLLIVCDIAKWEIHTNFTNTPTRRITFNHTDLRDPYYISFLRLMFTAPEKFHPDLNRVQITEDVAAKFKGIVDDLIGRGLDPQRIARYVTKLVFCLFVEDIGLLTRSSADLFTQIVDKLRRHPQADELFPRYMRELFTNMASGGSFNLEDVAWFNGAMFRADDEDVFPLSYDALNTLYQASERDWSHVEPSIFGTLFERTLDEKKRAQLGAHYTDPADILEIVEPVLMQPLRRAWDDAQAAAAPIRERYVSAKTESARADAEADLIAVRGRMLEAVRTIRVLDPACGSGNFLYMSLRRLLDLEKLIVTHPLWTGLPREDIRVNPTQLYGIEKNEIAHALANVVVWIGYIQWRYENGFFQIKRPILRDMRDNIVHRDAILDYDADGTPREPEWQAADVIVGNPPFLGAKWMRGELGNEYVDKLRNIYGERVPGTADLVMYWFEKARTAIEHGVSKRAGLLATNTVRQGGSAKVLQRIKETGDIFFALADHIWQLPGASLRVSLIGFDDGSEGTRELNERSVSNITPELTEGVTFNSVATLAENQGLAFRGHERGGPFLLRAEQAQQLLKQARNSEVVHPWFSGDDLVTIPLGNWIIDFGKRNESEAAEYADVFEFVRLGWEKGIERQQVKFAKPRTNWWQHRRPADDLREALVGKNRYIATPLVSKHRVFVWLPAKTRPDTRLVNIARDDDYFFGVLHSMLHEKWSLRLGAWHAGERPTYTTTTTFETFPFPFVPRTEDFSDPRVEAVSAAAKRLHEERHAWLNPPQWTPRSDERTLTHLYNALQAQRGRATWRGVKAAAAEFAPRLLELHDALDRAVIAAYGWDAALLDDEEALLRHLLALNGERARA